MCRVINHFGKRFRHTSVALDSNFDAAEQLSPGIEISLITPKARKGGSLYDTMSAARTIRRLGPDPLMTHNWGTMERAIVNRVLPSAPHNHFEAGFGKEEAGTQLYRRAFYRRWVLARCTRVVLPSHRLVKIARDNWRLPSSIVFYLPNGVDVGHFSAPVRDPVPTILWKSKL
jgi:Glycosyltransferase Family 4